MDKSDEGNEQKKKNRPVAPSIGRPSAGRLRIDLADGQRLMMGPLAAKY
jgi:hypothetical protein